MQPPFFFRRASSLSNSHPLVIRSSARHTIFANHLNFYCHLSKDPTHHLFGIDPHRTASYVACFTLPTTRVSPIIIVMFVHAATELHLSFHYNINSTASAALNNYCRGILAKCRIAEHFEILGHVDLFWLFLLGVPDASILISVVFLTLSTTFWHHSG